MRKLAGYTGFCPGCFTDAFLVGEQADLDAIMM